MTLVHYVGSSDSRTIFASNFAANGVSDQGTTTWNESNLWQVNVSTGAGNYLLTLSDFSTTGIVRPGTGGGPPGPPPGDPGLHPSLATHDALGLATQAELDAVAAMIAAPHPSLAAHDTLGLATQTEVDALGATYVPLAGDKTITGVKDYTTLGGLQYKGQPVVRVNEVALSFLDPRVGGVVGGVSSTNSPINNAAWTAALALLPGGGRLFFPPGDYHTTASIAPTANSLEIHGASREKTRLSNTSTDLFAPPAALRAFVLDSLTAQATNGHVFKSMGLAQSTFDNVRMLQYNANKRLFDQDHVGVAGTYIDNLVVNCDLTAQPGVLVPQWYMRSANGDLNSNVWSHLRCTYSGDYFFHLENTDAQTYTYDNLFEDINFEICPGGAIRLLSAQNCTIERCWIYDSGTITKDLFHIGRSIGGTGGPGPGSRLNTFRNVARRGALAAGLFDVSFPAAALTGLHTFEACAAASTGDPFRVQLNGAEAQAIGMNAGTGVTWTNASNLISLGGAGKGLTAGRPAATGVRIGEVYFDTSLAKPIWSDGTVWRDATGTAV